MDVNGSQRTNWQSVELKCATCGATAARVAVRPQVRTLGMGSSTTAASALRPSGPMRVLDGRRYINVEASETLAVRCPACSTRDAFVISDRDIARAVEHALAQRTAIAFGRKSPRGQRERGRGDWRSVSVRGARLTAEELDGFAQRLATADPPRD